MNETPSSPPILQAPMAPHRYNPILEGLLKGAIAALTLALLYAFGVPLLFALMNQSLPFDSPTNLQDGGEVATTIANNYGNALMVGGMTFLIGAIPALIFGLIGGGIIGAIFRYGVKRRLSLQQVLLYGFGISFAIVGSRLFFIIQSEGSDFSILDPLFWILVAGPMIAAFLGFWWVMYQVNQKMPSR